MSLSLSNSIVLVLGFYLFSFSIANGNKFSHENPAAPSCPLNFNVLRKLVKENGAPRAFIDVQRQCQYVLEAIRLIRSVYLQTHGYFLPPSESSEACWGSYRSLIMELVQDFDIKSSCGYHLEWIAQGCMNVTSRSQFERLIPESNLEEVWHNCNQSLENSSQCALCTNSLSSLRAYLHEPENGNFSDCFGYPSIYAAAFINQFGPTDFATMKCLFSLQFSSGAPNKKRHTIALFGAVLGCVIGFLGATIAVMFIGSRTRNRREKKTLSKIEDGFVAQFGSIRGSTNLVRYNFEEIRSATMNFSRKHIIGKGGYGNVYKGILQDGSEVAVKRFKNCSVSGDATFAHEIEVIASVKHINLVGLRGYCTATVPLEGHQRMIVCDLMHNGSLHDHLFGSEMKKLSWPIRQKIALGTARGLAYLHNGALPAIIHRDIKSSNILLDESFEPKVADFGLAKFNPMGMTHLSTRVAGTLGYVAPEYALYGKLTEGSDVYSFGVVLLELLSGKKALLSISEGKTTLLTDWAWSLVSRGRALDVIEENMPEMGLPRAMEQYVLVAVLCCHPELDVRPSMDQIVKLLDKDYR
ncbi:probable LRR receptor-like serine/threonine-protein kinase RKF3 [Cornus florida]|uniref:probable LRR receptor-like serine/threonine-protein kinase RKF3 n=1 Tax=Cornus florida TaxID=4283 RepID=UPI0028A2B1CD|nr:probable LRR receptor-like serine/threonine-protein kinase RKF3 [Cornus florida]